METYALHIVVTRKIFKKVTKTIFPNKTPEISTPALRKRQFIRRCEQKINAIFFCGCCRAGFSCGKRFGVPRSRGPDRLKPEFRMNFPSSLSSFFFSALLCVLGVALR
jgi:hypothetical protein